MKTLCVVGAGGMLGKDMLAGFDGYTVVGVDREEMDIRKLDVVSRVMSEIDPDFVINCAAYTDVNGAESERDLAYDINAYGAGNVAKASRELDIPIVHISTNYIFDGESDAPYHESDVEFNPLNVYGMSKLRGEELVRDSHPKHYIVRTSNLFGPHGKNFVQTMVALAAERESLSVVNDQLGNPTYTKDLVQAIRELLEESAPYGVYHLTNSTPADAGISWYRFAKAAIKYKGLPTKVVGVSSEHYPSPAKRPRQGTLLNTKRGRMRPYQEALQEYLSDYLNV